MKHHSKHSVEAAHNSSKSANVPLWAKFTAGSLLVASTFGLSSLGQEAFAKPAKGDTTTATTAEKKPNKMEKKPQVILPTSNDPAELARAWMTNYINYTNTGDEKFMQFFSIGTNSDVAQQLRTERQKVADYQAQSHSKYHRYIPAGDVGIKVVSDMTTFPGTGMTITADVEVQEFLDNRALDPYSKNDIRKQFTVEQVERADPNHPEQTVEVWLPSFVSDLGVPPTSAAQANSHSKHAL